jgi:hypothetical protein
MDQQSSAWNVDNLLESAIPRTENAMAINGRQKEDRELAPFVWSDVDVGKKRAKQIRNPFHSQDGASFDRANILDSTIARAQECGVVGRNGTVLWFEATREHSVQ